MPRSKRNKVVSLTNVKKQGKEKKDVMVDNIREACEKYKNVVVLEFGHQRNEYLKEVRRHFEDSKLFMGKNKLMQLALGTSPENEVLENMHMLSNELTGQVGLLCTNKSVDEVKSYFAAYQPEDFARSGQEATKTIKLEKGEQTLAHMPHSIEAHLRSLGLPTQLFKGKIIMLGEHTVCQAGKELNTDQCQILKLLEIKMSKFLVTPKSVYEVASHKVRDL